MIKSIKVQLKPNNKQNSLLFQCAGVARWGYNWALDRQQRNYEAGGRKIISDSVLRKELTQLKQTKELKWLYKYSNNITKQAVKDACMAYDEFLNIKNKHYSKKTIAKAKRQNRVLTYRDLEGYPNFKSKKKSTPKFYQDNIKIKFNHTHVQLEKFGKVKLAEFGRIPVNGKYTNPRIKHDGLNWFVSVGIEMGDMTINNPTTESIGIDLGVKDLAIVSTEKTYKNINKTKPVKKANKRLKRLEKQASSQYESMKNNKIKEKGKNLLKLEKQINKTYKRLTNIRTDYVHQITTSLVIAKPEYIVIEDLYIKGMMKNKHLSKAIAEQKLHEFRRQLEYKCSWYGVPLILADKWYPSSKTCSCCGNIKKDLNLSDRVYKCTECGLAIDRDLNASINLREYPKLAKAI